MKSFNIPRKLTSIRGGRSSKLLQKAASIGLWEVFIDSNTVQWSDTTKIIHEVGLDYQPTISGGINFYKEGFYQEKITKDFNRCIADGKEFDAEYIIITPCGKEKWVRSVGVPVFKNGKCVKVYGVFQDIDVQKKADAVIYESKEKFQQTFEHAPIGIALASVEGNFTQTNSQFSKILGYSKEELVHKNICSLAHPDEKGENLEHMNELLLGANDNYQGEKRFMDKSGLVTWCILSVSLVRTEFQTPSHFIVQITNINSLKKANKKVKTLLEVTERKNNKLLNFKHIVSHNLRSHTSNLDMLLNFLEKDVPKVNDTEVYYLLKEAFKNLQETIVNLSEVSGYENCNKEDYKKLNLIRELERSIANIQAMIEEDGGIVTISRKSPLQVFVNPEYLRSSLLNILTNAVKYRKPTEALKISIKVDENKEYVVVSITDNGVGVNLDLHGEKIFGMYKTFHRHPDSRGLGLFIVKNQIEAMGGKVSVESEVGVGSTFKIFIPK